MSLWLIFFEIAVALVVVVFVYFKLKFRYWANRGFDFLPPSIPWGNIDNPLSPKARHFSVKLREIHEDLRRRNVTEMGMYRVTLPILFTTDLDFIKVIFTKDFNYFSDRSLGSNEKKDPMSAHLVNLDGPRWRQMRSKLTPAFTSGQLRLMFPLILACQENMTKFMANLADKPTAVDIKDALARFTTDVIGSCAFGLEFDTINDDNSLFRKHGRKIFSNEPRVAARRLGFTFFPNIMWALGFTKHLPETNDFFMKLVTDTVKYRQENQVGRKDIMQLLLNMTEKTNAGDEMLTVEQIAAQCFLFFAAGFETTSTTMTFTLYLLAKNQLIQDKVRHEINQVLEKHGGQLTYESIKDMTYLSQVIDESLRIYPPAAALARTCVKDYKVPGRDFVLEKGVHVMLSVHGIHMDPEYYPDPEKFDPDRFSEVNKATRPSYSFLPFGEGPRNCIGMRFALLEAKIGLVSMLTRFKFEVNSKTREPLEFERSSVVLTARGDIWLDIKSLDH